MGTEAHPRAVDLHRSAGQRAPRRLLVAPSDSGWTRVLGKTTPGAPRARPRPGRLPALALQASVNRSGGRCPRAHLRPSPAWRAVAARALSQREQQRRQPRARLLAEEQQVDGLEELALRAFEFGGRRRLGPEAQHLLWDRVDELRELIERTRARDFLGQRSTPRRVNGKYSRRRSSMGRSSRPTVCCSATVSNTRPRCSIARRIAAL